MKVSVVVPAFNQAAYLREALHSALAQTHRDLEIIVVDDGSTDDTRAACASFGDDRIRYVYQANDGTRGIGARNHAMLLAQGDWIALLDQDDRWAPTKIEQQLARAALTPGCGAVFCRVRFIDGQGEVTRVQEAPLPEGDVFHELLRGNRYFAASGMFRRDLISLFGLPNESCGLADWYLWLGIARHSPVVCVQEALADYREHDSGYQWSLLASNRRRFADDQWKSVHAQRTRWHPDCTECRNAHRRASREAAKLYFLAARVALASGQWSGVLGTVGMAMVSAPAWLLRPWTLVHQVLRLTPSALTGSRRLFARR